MFCGNCFRDNQMVAELRKLGHQVLMIPLYLPITLDEPDQSAGTPTFFGGINVYLEQMLPLLGKMPKWLHKQLASPAILKWASGRAAKTRASDLGDLTLSMMRGEEGNQVRELKELVVFLKAQPRPEVISLSNALLVGLARRLKAELNSPVVCMLQGEDSFLDSLPASHRQRTWDTLAERSRDVDLFIAPTKYFGDLMTRRLNLPPAKVRVVFNGIHLEGYSPASEPPKAPVLGYFARMCKEKGLHTLVEAFVILKKRNSVPGLLLHVGGGMGPADEPLVRELKKRLESEGFFGDATFFPNLTKEQKQQFYRRLSVLSVPALYGEAFGLYLLEAWASGVPVVQPPVASFPELISEAGAGVLAQNDSASALADAIEGLLKDEPKRHAMGLAGRRAVEARFNAAEMSREIAKEFATLPHLAALVGA